MSWSVHLFIDSADSLEAVSRELSSVLGISFRKIPEDGSFCYESKDLPYCYLALRGDHGFDNDRDKNFEDFAYYLSIDAHRDSDWESIRKSCLDFGRLAFEKLKKTGRFKLMLTQQLGTKLDLFSPESVSRQ